MPDEIIIHYLVYNSASCLDDAFTALSHPVRRGILELLAVGVELSVAELGRPFSVSPAQLTKHVAMLERALLVTRTRCGRTHLLRLRPEALGDAAGWLDQQRAFWSRRLDNLEELLRRE